jgi:putative transposase
LNAQWLALSNGGVGLVCTQGGGLGDAPDMQATLVCKALQLAVAQRQPAAGLIVHSDRGSQYASAAHQALLSKHGLVGNMSRKGNC